MTDSRQVRRLSRRWRVDSSLALLTDMFSQYRVNAGSPTGASGFKGRHRLLFQPQGYQTFFVRVQRATRATFDGRVHNRCFRITDIIEFIVLLKLTIINKKAARPGRLLAPVFYRKGSQNVCQSWHDFSCPSSPCVRTRPPYPQPSQSSSRSSYPCLGYRRAVRCAGR